MKEEAERKIAKNTAEIDEEKKGLKEYALLMGPLDVSEAEESSVGLEQTA